MFQAGTFIILYMAGFELIDDSFISVPEIVVHRTCKF